MGHLTKKASTLFTKDVFNGQFAVFNSFMNISPISRGNRLMNLTPHTSVRFGMPIYEVTHGIPRKLTNDYHTWRKSANVPESTLPTVKLFRGKSRTRRYAATLQEAAELGIFHRDWIYSIRRRAPKDEIIKRRNEYWDAVDRLIEQREVLS